MLLLLCLGLLLPLGEAFEEELGAVFVGAGGGTGRVYYQFCQEEFFG
jgi:hypothetical protein